MLLISINGKKLQKYKILKEKSKLHRLKPSIDTKGKTEWQKHVLMSQGTYLGQF